MFHYTSDKSTKPFYKTTTEADHASLNIAVCFAVYTLRVLYHKLGELALLRILIKYRQMTNNYLMIHKRKLLIIYQILVNNIMQ